MDLLSDAQASYTRRQQFQATLRLRLATGEARALPPVIRIMSGIPLPRRILPAPPAPAPVQSQETRPAIGLAARAARESIDFTPKGSRPVRVQIVNVASGRRRERSEPGRGLV